ncbi:MAG TPA: VOC family protein [Rhodanobacteraceae bacterium]|nr:VOC family protein [Rhodanobacteraceae bacterium]
MSHGIRKLVRIERNTPDIQSAVAFYRDALGFRVDDADATPPAWTLLPGLCDTPPCCAQLSLGAQTLVLTQFPEATPYPKDGASNDLCFQHCAIVVDDMNAAYDRVMRYGATPITQAGPQTLTPSTGSVTAFKFRDPDGHPLELLAFPQGTGDPARHSKHAGDPMLGIDHSAISVADAERSVLFYELLGLRIAARGVNQGVEQQRLDDLADVTVDVIALESATRTPHLELLRYRQPHGRANGSTRLTAVAADRLAWQAENVDVLLDALTDGDFADAVVASDFIRGATIALLRDPDGHLSVLNELPV